MTYAIRRRAALALTIVAAFALAACDGPSRGRMANPKPLLPENYTTPGIPTIFGDTEPIEWMEHGIRPDQYPIHGIDAARYQGEIDFVTAKANGVNFAWLKATEGGDHLDPGFEINAPRARAAGVPVGGYHFYYFCRTPAEQARWFIKNVPRMQGDLPPMLDMEWNHGSRTCGRRPDPDTVRDYIRQYVAIVQNHYGTAPVIYTTPDFYEENDLGRLVGYEFWLRSVAAHPSERYPQERWTFWQYSGTGVARGVKGNVDLNAFAGTVESWVGWLTARRQR
ncbi:MAG: GH25 family lysozyme [Maritimibacter harenae]|nr:GH25 family lysozyme [Maritimibacter harenae]